MELENRKEGELVMRITKEIVKGLLREMKQVVKEGKDLEYVIVLPVRGGLHLEVFKNQKCLVDKNDTEKFLTQLKLAKQNGNLTRFTEEFPSLFMNYLDVNLKNTFDDKKAIAITLQGNLVEIDKVLKRLIKNNILPVDIELDKDALKRVDFLCGMYNLRFNEETKTFYHPDRKYWDSLEPSKEEILRNIESYLSLDDKISLLSRNLDKGVPYLVLTFNSLESMNGTSALKVARGFIEKAGYILDELYYVTDVMNRIAKARSGLLEYKNSLG